ncbi:MAG: discoidin domain-containing protein, partial [Verrucomicrobiales bacterium]|nr:discoidin domain-containing protein [Verrucomicrobiales bacterium]
TLTAIPYATWANRGPTPMTVWVARHAERARVAPKPTLTSQAKVTTSYHRGGMDLAHVHDQLLPLNATDGFAPNFDFWPHKGTAEWIAYEFAAPARVSSVAVSWFDDTGRGECRLPTSWRVLYRTDANTWEPVKAREDYSIRKTDPVKVTFDPITTRALRLEIQLPLNFSAGLYEWLVE